MNVNVVLKPCIDNFKLSTKLHHHTILLLSQLETNTYTVENRFGYREKHKKAQFMLYANSAKKKYEYIYEYLLSKDCLL